MSEETSASENGIARHRAELGGSIYVIVFLLVAAAFARLSYWFYTQRLVHGRQFSRFIIVSEHSDTGIATVFLAELIIVILVYRLGPLRMTLRDMGLNLALRKLDGFVWGILAGVFAYGGSLPLVLKFDRSSGLTRLIIGDFYHPAIIAIVVLFAVLLPVTSEIVLRGIIFKSFLESSNVMPAILLSSSVFALVWPVYDPMTGFLLGVATALLYYRFRVVYPAIVANVVVTISVAATLVCRRLY